MMCVASSSFPVKSHLQWCKVQDGNQGEGGGVSIGNCILVDEGRGCSASRACVKSDAQV